tara:strand:- start:188 stop:505 length:318 start_codon:yes stop_codon:yes gene_type:complete
MSNYKDIGIAYFTNPAMENEPFGKEVNGIMTSVARKVPVRKVDTYSEVSIVEAMKPQNLPSIIFTNSSGDLEHMRVEGVNLTGITVEKVMETVEAIDRYNKTGKV